MQHETLWITFCPTHQNSKKTLQLMTLQFCFQWKWTRHFKSPGIGDSKKHIEIQLVIWINSISVWQLGWKKYVASTFTCLKPPGFGAPSLPTNSHTSENSNGAHDMSLMACDFSCFGRPLPLLTFCPDLAWTRVASSCCGKDLSLFKIFSCVCINMNIGNYA